MTRPIRTLLPFLLSVSTALGLPDRGGAEVQTVARPVLDHAAPSSERLIEDFLSALRDKDPEALRRLRVSETEYKTVIMPGSVKEGQRPRVYRPEVSDVAWGLLDTKSRYYEIMLLETFGGRTLAIEKVEFEEGTERYLNHTAHKQLRLMVRDEAGTTGRLATGSIVEIDGQYKFISFIND